MGLPATFILVSILVGHLYNMKLMVFAAQTHGTASTFPRHRAAQPESRSLARGTEPAVRSSRAEANGRRSTSHYPRQSSQDKASRAEANDRQAPNAHPRHACQDESSQPEANGRQAPSPFPRLRPDTSRQWTITTFANYRVSDRKSKNLRVPVKGSRLGR